MLSCQSELLSLPLPSLSETCSKYLDSVKPFLSEKEFFETEFQVNLFQNGPGKDLHKTLESFSKHSRNWLQEHWYNAYLDYRGPLPALSNIGGGVEPLHEYEKPLLGSAFQRGAVWLSCMVKEYLKIVRQEYPVQRSGKVSPMDMTQYVNMFCGGRIPGRDRDIQVHSCHILPTKDGTAVVMADIKHIVVLIRGRIFQLKIFDSSGILLTPQNLERQLLKIKALCDAKEDGISIGSLTAADRNTWYQMYKRLCLLDRQNKINIDVINEAIMAFAFDENVQTHNLQDTSEHSILGDCTNRWFDKSLTGIVSATGLVVTNEDHIHLDGNVGCQILQNGYDEIVRSQYQAKDKDILQEMTDPIELNFVVDDVILNTIKDTQYKHRHMLSSIELCDKPINGFGKDFSKSIQVHPDTLIQLAIQLAYYTLHKQVGSTYESATSRVYYHGRTETCRSCTLECKRWVEAMVDKNCSVFSRKELFLCAAKKHQILMFEACTGKGIDRHLFVLKKLAEEKGFELPGIYTDKAWKLSGGDGNFLISTSLAGFMTLHGGLSPMVHDGYGVFYTIKSHRINILVSGWKTSLKTNHQEFYQSIVDALIAIRELFMPSKL